jgi:ATP-dependent DNA helicase RecQ
MGVYEELQARGLIAQVTNEEEIKKMVNGRPKARPIRPIESDSIDETLLDALRQLRRQIAEREKMPAYIIFSDDALADMVEKKPITIEAFREIRGVGQIKLDKYGKVFVALIRFVLKLPNQ